MDMLEQIHPPIQQSFVDNYFSVSNTKMLKTAEAQKTAEALAL